MKRYLIAFMVILTLTLYIGCAFPINDNNSKFKAYGSIWSAETELENNLIKENGKEYFIVTLKYNGDISNLKEFKRMFVAYGTETMTCGVTIYDRTTKEEYKKNGKYDDETERQYGIKIMEFKNIEKPELRIPLPYYKKIREDLLKDRMSLIIEASKDFYDKDTITDNVEFNNKTIDE